MKISFTCDHLPGKTCWSARADLLTVLLKASMLPRWYEFMSDVIVIYIDESFNKVSNNCCKYINYYFGTFRSWLLWLNSQSDWCFYEIKQRRSGLVPGWVYLDELPVVQPYGRSANTLFAGGGGKGDNITIVSEQRHAGKGGPSCVAQSPPSGLVCEQLITLDRRQ